MTRQFFKIRICCQQILGDIYLLRRFHMKQSPESSGGQGAPPCPCRLCSVPLGRAIDGSLPKPLEAAGGWAIVCRLGCQGITWQVTSAYMGAAACPALSRCERQGETGERRHTEGPQEPRNGSHVATTGTCVTDRGRFCISVIGSPLQRWHVSSHHQHTLPRAGLRTGSKCSRASLPWGL